MNIKKIGLIGTGLMGGGIAQVCAQAGYQTISYDVNSNAFERTQTNISESLEKMVTRGKFTREFVNETLSRMKYSTNISDLAGCDIVVEAVFENIDVKKAVLKQVEDVVSPECLIFTNTSGLSITTLSTALTKPSRFMGTHFFSPVPAMKLVELVPGMETSDETYRTAAEWVESINKIHIKAPDTSGFITNRLFPIIQIEMAELIALGVKAEDIDACYKLFTKAPVGTMEMADQTGLDVTLGCMTSVYEGLGDERYRPHHYIRKLTAAGHLGLKTGKGFYDWTQQQ